MVIKATKVTKAFKVFRVFRVFRAKLDPKAIPARKALLALLLL